MLTSLDHYLNVYFFVRLKLFSRPLIVSEVILSLQILFLSLYVLVRSIILRAQAGVLHVKVKPLGSTGKSGSWNTKLYHLEQVNIWKELCQLPWETICLIATTQYLGAALKYWGGSVIIGFWTFTPRNRFYFSFTLSVVKFYFSLLDTLFVNY